MYLSIEHGQGCIGTTIIHVRRSSSTVTDEANYFKYSIS